MQNKAKWQQYINTEKSESSKRFTKNLIKQNQQLMIQNKLLNKQLQYKQYERKKENKTKSYIGTNLFRTCVIYIFFRKIKKRY